MKQLMTTLALAAALTAPAAAQPVTTLQECVAEALANNPSMQSGLYSIARARDLQGTAWDLPATAVTLSQTPVDGGGPENALTFSQSLEFPTLYGARRARLKAATRLEEIRHQMSRRELEREVADAYYTLLAAREVRRALAEQDSTYAHFLFLAEARLRAGEAGRLEQINAKRLLDGCRLMEQEADADVANAVIRLQALMNSDRDVAPAEAALTAVAVPLGLLDDTFVPGDTPALRLLAQEGEVARREVGVARQSFLPEISLAASTQALIKGFNPYGIERSRFEKGNFMGFEVGLSVPLFFGARRAALKAAQLDVEINRAQTEAEHLRAEAGWRTARNDYRRLQRALDYHVTVANPDAAEIQRIAQVSYEKGAIDYMEYIQNIQVAMEQRLAYIDALDACNKAAIQLLYFQP